MIYDVIVVGAGPAGSSAARECASKGLSVLVLDKAEFPRDKPCGGAVSIRASSLLPFEITPVVERVISRVRFSEHVSKGFERSSPRTLTHLTQRSRLDAYLLERAIASGAILREGSAVRSIDRLPSRTVVRADGQSFEGRTLVAADGANGKTASLAGIDAKLSQGIALEGNISPPGGVPTAWGETMGFDFSGLPGGYGWIFPKDDHLNIGLGGWKHVGPTLRDRLTRLVRMYGFDPSGLWGVRGHHLPVRQRGSPLVDGNVLLIGDAAGLLDPMTAEGIYAAIWSGRRAAGELVSYLSDDVSDLEGYGEAVERELAAEMRIARRFHDVFHLWPGLFVALERRTSLLWKAVELLIRGDQTYLTVKRQLGPVWPMVEFASDLIRVSPPLRRLAGLRDPAPAERFFKRGPQHSTP